VDSEEEDRARLLELADAEAADADLADSLRWAADASPVDALERGNDLVEGLHGATGPKILLAKLDLVAKDDRRALVDAVYACVVLSRIGEDTGRKRRTGSKWPRR
jgi:hypothetical protein